MEAGGLAFMPLTPARDGPYVLAMSREDEGEDPIKLSWTFPDREHAHLFVLLCQKALLDG